MSKLWADALCINQGDDDEKSKQIPLMRQIFRGSRRVLAWLGPFDDSSAEYKGMRALQSFSQLSQQAAFAMLNVTFDSQAPDQTERNSIFQKIQHASCFLQVPWFTRLWIIQEVVFNPDVEMFCGVLNMSWARFDTALTALASISKLYPDHIAAVNDVVSLWRQNTGDRIPPRSQFNLLNMVAIMEQFHAYKCTDDRDRIHALLGMADEDTLSVVHYDYAQDVQETYKMFAMQCISAGLFGDILEAIFQRQHMPSHPGWPSFAPDWRIQRQESRPLTSIKIDAKVISAQHPSIIHCTMTGSVPHSRLQESGALVVLEVNVARSSRVLDAIRSITLASGKIPKYAWP
ncbi:hypothetical protein NX059_001875 [Plenodomus lindquistii]|nr:hypothetical protein NX059_001875 [Plenodomus lindquistii]